MTGPCHGVSVVVPVCNGARWLRQTLAALVRECDGVASEIIAVDDGSSDGSRAILAETRGVKIIDGPGRGIAAAINAGVREAVYPLIAQVDQDVVVEPGWLTTLLGALSDPDGGAAQGRYITDPAASFWARVMGRDLDDRYDNIADGSPGLTCQVDHVCTGNTIYRASALWQVGLLDEALGYGSDNDLSYRLTAAGYRLRFCPEARSAHAWRPSVRGYLAQQYGVGYGRLDVVARHPGRVRGDAVSGPLMVAHAPLALAAVILALGAVALALLGRHPGWPLAVAGAVLTLLAAERTVAGVRVWRRTGDRVALSFPLAHLLRDLAWSAAIVAWLARRMRGRGTAPGHSMPRPPRRISAQPRVMPSPYHDALALIPAHNEAPNLRRVVRELRRMAPGVDILIVNDASSDGTSELLPRMGARWISLPQRLGVGGAVRAGLRYADQHGYRHVIRVDGDGQHRACDVPRLLAPVVAGQVDVAIGSRFLNRPTGRLLPRRLSQAALACGLSIRTGRRVTDPTSGLWCFGPAAVRLLARHHPSGYAEPELILFLARNGVRIGEVSIRMRPRQAGRTSLTVPRLGLALARTLLALLIVPLRRVVDNGRD